jgi:hypothetical protein
MGREHRAWIAGLLVAAQALTACTSWRVQSITPQELLSRDHPKAIQVRERGGAEYVLESPQVLRDSLIGFATASIETASFTSGMVTGTRVERRIAMTAVDHIAVKQSDGVKTGFLFVGVLLLIPAIYLGALIIGCSGGQCN